MSRCDYDKAELHNECNEMLYLYQTWQKVKNYRQGSTGIDSLDDLLIMLFGVPYTDFFERKKQVRFILAYKIANKDLLEKLSYDDSRAVA